MQAPETRFAEVLCALGSALDLAEGQPQGHAVRTGLIGMRAAGELGLDAESRSALYYALLLANAGGPGTAADVTQLLDGDDRVLKARFAVIDWTRAAAAARYGLRYAGSGRPAWSRTRAMARTAGTAGRLARAFIAGRAERGAAVARRLGLPAATAEAIRDADEHWDGRGYPDGVRGDAIPPAARIVGLARTLDVFASAGGPDAALRMARARRGTWFDPSLADLAAGWRDDAGWWTDLRGPDAAARFVSDAPDGGRVLDDTAIDHVASVIGEIIDSKRPWTKGHSARVAILAAAVGRSLGAGPRAQRRLFRAGLLHDIGELGVANRSLDASGALTPAEFTEIKEHPRHTYEILAQVAGFAALARLAAMHHERLDGSGYPRGLAGDEIGPEVRALTVAEVYDALTIWRPYREALSREEALMLMRSDAGLDRAAVAVLEAVVGEEDAPEAEGPAHRQDSIDAEAHPK